ncbi:MAG: hypothetical protein Rubg2KO_06320 [Rubricoccaceae bacterium]
MLSRVLLVLCLIVATEGVAQDRTGWVTPISGVPLDPVDLLRAENPEQAFDVSLEAQGGAIHIREGEEIRFIVTSERAGHLTLVSRDEKGDVRVLYPNKRSRTRPLEAGVPKVIGAEFRITARPPFGRETLKALVTQSPLISAESLARTFGSTISVSGPPSTSAGTDLGGLNRSSWGTASLAVTTVPAQVTGAPPPPPPMPQPAYSPTAPLATWLDRYRDEAGPDAVVRKWPAFAPTMSEPDHDSTIVVVYEPTSGTRSFGTPAGGGGLFNRVRIVEPVQDAFDASGTRSLHGSFGRSFEDVIEGLSKDPDVFAAVPNYTFQSLGWRSEIPVELSSQRRDTSDVPLYWDSQWGLHNAFYESPEKRLDVAWQSALQEYRSPDDPVVVAVLDTGIRFDNPHLRSVLWRNQREVAENGIDDDGNGFVDDVRGWDTVDGDGDPTDPSVDESHGTFVAAQIGGGGGSIQSMAPDVIILPIRVLDAEGNGSLRQLFEGIRYAVHNGARVINLSFGMRPLETPKPNLDRALKALFAEANAHGVVMVIAAGNHSADSRASYTYPSRVRGLNTISTAALTMTGSLAEFSNRGPEVDVAAPGQAIVSHPGRNLEVGAFDGTSMAAPFVSALAAMIIAQHPDWTPAEVRAAIVETVRRIPNLDVGSQGLIDAAAALSR